MGGGASFTEHFLLQFTIIVPLLLLVSTLYFVLVERPCMNKDWPRNLVEWSRSATWRTMPDRLSSLWR
jgi:peptidoglycan/LPS O-acetylase OafA/YrhL